MPGSLRWEARLAELRIDVETLAQFMRSSDGPVFQAIIIAGDLVKQEAIAIAPVSKPDPIPRRKPVVPGRLRDSIVKRVGVDSGGVYCRVGSSGNIPYANFVHEGTNPHTINAKPGGLLVFAGRDGAVVRCKSVNHPGNQPNRFMSRAAINVLGADHFSGVA